MSSPLDRDVGPDELSPYAPKWARDADYARRRATAPKHEDGVEAGEPEPSARRSESGLTIDHYPVPRSLEPTLMSEPQVRSIRSAMGVLALFAIASAIAAIVALFVVGKFPTSWTVSAKEHEQDAPSFGSRFSGRNAGRIEEPEPPAPQLSLRQEGPRASGEALPLGVSLTGPVEGASIIVDGLAYGSTVTAGYSSGTNRWRIPASDMRGALVQPPNGYVGPMDVVLELRLSDDTPVDRKPLHLEWATAAPPQVSAVAQSPADLKQKFEQFVVNYAASTGQTTFSAREKEILFTRFQQFLDSQMGTRPNR
jgi:hypothetical protein